MKKRTKPASTPPPSAPASLANPTLEEAYEFAQMVFSGFPPVEAIRYFTPSQDPVEVEQLANHWQRDPNVQAQFLKLQGKAFHKMSPDERIKYSLDQHYAQLAYFIYSHNYSTLSAADRTKADTARAALEAKVAGTSGQFNPLQQFWEDSLKAGKLKIGLTKLDKSITVTSPDDPLKLVAH